MSRVVLRSTVVLLGLGVTLLGCAAAQLGDQLPAGVGLPAGTPSRPAAPYQYPAVHDMPPDRATAPMTEEQQFTLEKDLKAARDRQQATKNDDIPEGGKTTAKKPGPSADKKSEAAKKKPPAGPIIVPPAAANNTGSKSNTER